MRLVQTACMRIPVRIRSERQGDRLDEFSPVRRNARRPRSIIATSILAFTDLNWVYLSISGLGLLIAAGFYLTFKEQAPSMTLVRELPLMPLHYSLNRSA